MNIIAITTTILIGRIEKQYSVKIEFNYIGDFGLFCGITPKNGIERNIKIADINDSYGYQDKLVRKFLEIGIHEVLKPTKTRFKEKNISEDLKEEIKVVRRIQKMRAAKVPLKDIATKLDKSMSYVSKRSKDNYINKRLEKEGIICI